MTLSSPPDGWAPGAAPAADDCPMLGRTIARNFANPIEKNMPDTWSVKKNKEMNIKGKAALGGTALDQRLRVARKQIRKR